MTLRVAVVTDKPGWHGRELRWMVLEVNSIPAWRGLQAVSRVRIAESLAGNLAARYLDQCRTLLTPARA